MGYENKTGLGGVSNYYGARDTGGSVGYEGGDGAVKHLSIAFTGQSINEGFLPPVVVPRGARIRSYILRVDEAFSLSGTTPAIAFGEAGAEATNGVSLSQAELQAVGTKVPASTGAGTWSTTSATGTTADKKVGKAITGTVSPGAGKATLMVEYYFKTKK